MNKITTTRLNEMSTWGYMNTGCKLAEALKQIIDNAYSEWQNDDTYFTDKKESEIIITPKTETQQNCLRGMNSLFPELISVCICIDLNSAKINDIDKLVREIYKREVA